MTPDELRHVDALVAGAMGWKLTPDPHYHGLGGAVLAVMPSGDRRFMWHLKENVYSGETRWSPATRWSAAGEVVDFLARQDTPYHLRLQEHWIDEWEAWFIHPINEPSFNSEQHGVTAETAPLAICLAFLRAMGVEVGE